MTRQYCNHCAYPIKTCVCESIELVEIPFRVIILQHKKESKHAKNTARLAKLISPSIEIVELTNTKLLNTVVYSLNSANVIVLYPNEGSFALEDYSLTQGFKKEEVTNNNLVLVLIDASWRQAYGIYQQQKWLNIFPNCHFDVIPLKQYSIRKSKKGFQLSTIEALARSIEILSGKSGQAYLNIFNYMQDKWKYNLDK